MVIGGGIVGAATALALARRGAGVALVERDAAGPAQGSSKGSARIFCPAPYPDESYLELGLRALEGWRAIESRAGRQLLVRTGALTTGRFAERAAGALQAAGEPAQLLGADDALRRFGVDTDGRTALHQAEAGVIHAARAHEAMLRLAAEAGAACTTVIPWSRIEPDSTGVTVTTRRVRYRCETTVVAAGPWSRGLLAPAGIELEATVSAQTIAYLSVREGAGTPVALMDFDGDEPYGLFDPEYGLKVAFHTRGLDAGDAGGPPDIEPAAVAELERWARRAYPGVVDASAGVEACFYTRTPGERFVIDATGRSSSCPRVTGRAFSSRPRRASAPLGSPWARPRRAPHEHG